MSKVSATEAMKEALHFITNIDSSHKSVRMLRAALEAVSSIHEAAGYHPQVIHYDGKGDGYHEFINADVPAITDPFEARNVEAIRSIDGDRPIIGFRIYDAHPTPVSNRVTGEEIIDSVMLSQRYAPKVIPMGANPPLFDGMQPDNDGPWVSRVDVAKQLRDALALVILAGPVVEALKTDLRLLQKRFNEHVDYGIDLARIIEALTSGKEPTLPKTSARYHYNMALAYFNSLPCRAITFTDEAVSVAWDRYVETSMNPENSNLDCMRTALNAAVLACLSHTAGEP